MVILVDRLDRVADAVVIAKRARAIAVQSIVVGIALSGVAMAFAAFGWLTPVADALIQEGNALRALVPGRHWRRMPLPSATALALRQEHEALDAMLNRMREIADALDHADAVRAVTLIEQANLVVQELVKHERSDESKVYPRLAKFLRDGHGLGAMSRAHREIMRLARLLDRLTRDLVPMDADRYLVRDAQRVIEAIEALVRIQMPRKRTSMNTQQQLGRDKPRRLECGPTNRT